MLKNHKVTKRVPLCGMKTRGHRRGGNRDCKKVCNPEPRLLVGRSMLNRLGAFDESVNKTVIRAEQDERNHLSMRTPAVTD